MSLLTTPLDALHRELGARMVPFAGYAMPVQYPEGIIREHLHTRAAAGLFDVSHMGQVTVEGPHATAELEALVPADLVALPLKTSVYTLLMNDNGGVRDDLIITREADDRFSVVVNAACKAADVAYMQAAMPTSRVSLHDGLALLALQGPAARSVLERHCPEAAALTFMTAIRADVDGADIGITCSGYTGEDGFELSVPEAEAERIARQLLAEPEVEAVGLGARDSLRLEAGLCLYGHELSPDITPVEANLRWAIARARRADGARAGGYPGAAVIAHQLEHGTARLRVGLVIEGKRPVREGQTVEDASGAAVGSISSGAFGASAGGPVAMAYVNAELAAIGTELRVDVRGTRVQARVAKLPLVAQNYHRG